MMANTVRLPIVEPGVINNTGTTAPSESMNEASAENSVLCHQGFPDALRVQAAELYDAAFATKLALAIPDADKRLTVLAEAFVPKYAFVVMSNGQLIGLAGFKTRSGSLTGGMTLKSLYKILGPLAAIRATIVLLLYGRTFSRDQLLMDGIAVSPAMRGKGAGTLLLRELQAFARNNGFRRLRLDVIDTNSSARRLYERMGFVATYTTRFSYLRWLLGFGAATTMEYCVQSGTTT